MHECGGPDIGGEQDFVDAARAGRPLPEVLGYWGELDGVVERARELGAVGAGGDLFADGALGSRTAHLCTPYAGDDRAGGTPTCRRRRWPGTWPPAPGPDCRPASTRSATPPSRRCSTAWSAAAARGRAEAVRAARHRIEHAEMLDGPLIARMARHGLVASVQPGFDARWGGPDGMYVAAARRRAGRAP